MNPTPILPNKTINFRLVLICVAAVSVGLSMALVSIAKLSLLLGCLLLIVGARRSTAPNADAERHLKTCYTPVAVLIATTAFALSLLWTVAPQADALVSFAKYGKLVEIVLLMVIIRSRQEAVYALTAFIGGQIFLVTSSWLLFAHVSVPWATSYMAVKEHAVFSTYLDQGIMSTVAAAICWHLRGLAPGRFGKPLAIFLALLCVSNVLFVLVGRSGHAAAIALLSLAIMWELPKKYRGWVVVLPFVIVAILFLSSPKVRDRLNLVKSDVQSYSTQIQPDTSSGIRLELWRTALQSIADHPVAGSGVGSWSTEYDRLQRIKNPAHKTINANGNPHQEYLQWGVQLGIPGVLLFLAFMIAFLRDTLAMETTVARAAQSTLVAFSVACLFNSSLYDALIGDFFCVIFGLLLAMGAYPKSKILMGANGTTHVTSP